MFKLLPTEAEAAQHQATVKELADALYKQYDTALPQPWVDAALWVGRDVRGDFVWNYDPVFPDSGLNTFGVPGPLTEEAAKWLQEHEEKVNDRLRNLFPTSPK